MTPGAAFTQKLHLIYLINDLLHYWLVFELDSLMLRVKKLREGSKHWSQAKITKKSVIVLLFSVRKNAEDLKNALEMVVIPMFCNATISKFIVDIVDATS